MIKKTLNQNAKYAQELLKTAEPDFVFSDKPINRLKIIENNSNFKSKKKDELLLNLREQINSIQNCNLLAFLVVGKPLNYMLLWFLLFAFDSKFFELEKPILFELPFRLVAVHIF